MPASYDTIADRPLRALELLVADCPAFQEAVGAANFDAALNSIYVEEADDTTEPPPRAIVADDPDWRYFEFARGAFQSTGGLYLCLELPWDQQLQPTEKEARYAFRNRWGRICEQMGAKSGLYAGNPLLLQSHLHVTAIEKVGVTLLQRDVDQNQSAGVPDFFSALFLIRYQG